MGEGDVAEIVAEHAAGLVDVDPERRPSAAIGLHLIGMGGSGDPADYEPAIAPLLVALGDPVASVRTDAARRSAIRTSC
jgi:hypothetical protein